ncbi:hypothetical protein DsansV1_C20g0164331 [Dioscorea sansibarensis]
MIALHSMEFGGKANRIGEEGEESSTSKLFYSASRAVLNSLFMSRLLPLSFAIALEVVSVR